MIITGTNTQLLEKQEMIDTLVEGLNLMYKTDLEYSLLANTEFLEEKEDPSKVSEKLDVEKAQSLLNKVDSVSKNSDNIKKSAKNLGIVAALSYATGKIVNKLGGKGVIGTTVKVVKGLAANHTTASVLSGAIPMLLISFVGNQIYKKVKAQLVTKRDSENMIDLALAAKYIADVKLIMKKLDPKSKEYKMLDERLKSILASVKKAKSENKSLKESFSDVKELLDYDILAESLIKIYEDTVSESISDEYIKRIDSELKSIKRINKSIGYGEKFVFISKILLELIKAIDGILLTIGTLRNIIPKSHQNNFVFHTLNKHDGKLKKLDKFSATSNKFLLNKATLLIGKVVTTTYDTIVPLSLPIKEIETSEFARELGALMDVDPSSVKNEIVKKIIIEARKDISKTFNVVSVVDKVKNIQYVRTVKATNIKSKRLTSIAAIKNAEQTVIYLDKLKSQITKNDLLDQSNKDKVLKKINITILQINQSLVGYR